MGYLSKIEISQGNQETRRAVQEQLGALQDVLDQADVIEVVVNRPGEVWIETRTGWQMRSDPSLTFVRLERLAKATAAFAAQAFRTEWPILSAALPSGARIQIAGPPATAAGIMSVTIRKPSSRSWSLEELETAGLFEETGQHRINRNVDAELKTLLDRNDTKSFLAAAVKAKKNILISGATGSGKTTLSKALIAEIPNA